MWIEVLPADPTKEVLFKEVPDDQEQALGMFSRLVAGHVQRVYTQVLYDTFGALPRIVMLINEDGQAHNLPINKKATKYYPNDYGLDIRGDAVLVGEVPYIVEGEPANIFVSMPLKWKVIYDMETLAGSRNWSHDTEPLHSGLDDLLLSVADPDVRKMYEEIRDNNNWYYS